MRYVTAKGAKVPVLGFGTWDVFGAEGRRTIEEALSLGYRHIDTAQMYGNEAEVGAAIRSSGIDRSELFITTKIDNANHGREATRRSTADSLRTSCSCSSRNCKNASRASQRPAIAFSR